MGAIHEVLRSCRKLFANGATGIAALILTMTAVSCDNDSKWPNALTPTAQRAPAPDSISGICTAAAARKKKEVGRPPPYDTMTSSMPYIDEAGGYADAYLGATYLRVPLGYAPTIDYGLFSQFGGQSVLFEAYLPDFKPHLPGGPPVQPRADGKPFNVLIFASCNGTAMSSQVVAARRKLTEEDYIGVTRKSQIKEGIRVPGFISIPELRLRVWPTYPVTPTNGLYGNATYFALDPKLTYPLGDVFAFKCTGDQLSATRQFCIGNFFVLPNVTVKYNFPYQWLDHWQEVYEFTLKLVTTSIQE